MSFLDSHPDAKKERESGTAASPPSTCPISLGDGGAYEGPSTFLRLARERLSIP
jgi:hypothetical protein